ncbi:tyrosine-type recombinase/integrase [Bacillus megaterium]|nr:tyrosine-type recombinase/integrase [Priestia megaterium]
MLTYNKYRNISIKKKRIFPREKLIILQEMKLPFLWIQQNSALLSIYRSYYPLRTGMRKGELIALHWDDINFKDKTISITKTRSSHGVKPPKTKRSMRTISIDDTLVTELKISNLAKKK